MSPSSAVSVEGLSVGGGGVGGGGVAPGLTKPLPRPTSPSPSLVSEKTEADLQVNYIFNILELNKILEKIEFFMESKIENNFGQKTRISL